MLIKVLFISKYTILGQGLSCLLRQEKDLKLVGEVATGKEAMHQVRELSPDAVLIDIALPEGDAPEVLEWIKKTYTQIKTVALSFQDYHGYVIRIIRADASGILLRNLLVKRWSKRYARLSRVKYT